MFQIQVQHYACSRLLEKYVNFFFNHVPTNSHSIMFRTDIIHISTYYFLIYDLIYDYESVDVQMFV